VTATIVHIARWLAWQLGEPERPRAERPASITVFSSPES
jgi:hypothetical protein